MNHNAAKHQRRSIRLPGYDYAQTGAYFVTMVTKERLYLFGEVLEGEMRLNEYGRVIQMVWNELPDHYSSVECDEFILMPNHVHGIILLVEVSASGEFDVGAGLKPDRGVAAGAISVRAG